MIAFLKNKLFLILFSILYAFSSIAFSYEYTSNEEKNFIEIYEKTLPSIVSIEADIQSSNPSAHLISYAEATIANTLELAQHTALPIMSASGITAKTAPLAFASGASAVGVGSAVNKLDSEIAMSATVMAIVSSVSHRNSINHEIVRTERELFV